MAEIIELLDQFEDEIARDMTYEAEATAEEILEYYQNNIAEQLRYAQARLARDNGSIDRSRKLYLHEFIQQFVATDLQRSSFMLAVSSYLSRPSEFEDSEIREITKSLIEEEEAIGSVSDGIDEIVGEIDLPPEIEIIGPPGTGIPYPKGTKFTVSPRLHNLGDTSAKEVAIEVENPSGILLEPEEVTLGDVEANTGLSPEFEVSPIKSGEFDISFEGSSENAGGSVEEIQIQVLSKDGFVDLAEERIRKIRDRVRQEGSKRIGKSLTSKLDAAIAKLDDARKFIGRGMERQANNMIETAMNQIKAAANQLQGLNGKVEFPDDMMDEVIAALRNALEADV